MSFRTSEQFPDELLTSLPDVSSVHRHGDTVVVTGVRDVVTDVVLALHGAGIRARQVRVESASLEQAFLSLTGDAAPPPAPGGTA
jgi:ABC-2 type transport system ATP-binding protein